ncbi:hypothetical protein KFE96_03005 [Kordiimonas sp. SCSIO 12603]|uniref:hypothetical protein n=1 Tax=Kordiimonas sp. SCSIO 12603 TaxID=2829596 RepID=UPI002102F7BD|nr:hypothetical protein [Kordiimonas sp. SCSIO 12603]UTW59292.1 hypothetical protein KFE96_03005 [Kordiimonas sp. SCSIO 12603]
MGKILQNFFRALNEQEKLFQAELATDNLGIALRAAVNELDWYDYNLRKVAELNAEQHEQFSILTLGVTRLIKLALDARPSYDVPVVCFPRTKEITIKALNCVSGIGIIQHGRRVAQTVSSGRAKIELTNEKEFDITLPDRIHDENLLEKAVFEHYTAQSYRQFEEIMSSELFQELHEKVSDLLQELVYPFAEHYIGYEADPTLDAYFLGIALHRLKGERGYDSFKYDLKFGGIEFQKYLNALTFLIGSAIRHERFAEALAEKEEKSYLENLLTISVDNEPFIESLRDAINFLGEDLVGYTETTTEEAATIFKVLSVGRDSTEMLDRPGCALPLLIRVSDTAAIRCQTAAFHFPMQFLLDSLRWHFPEDYSKNQATREQSMQAAVERVMSEAFPNLIFRQNVKLRLDGQTLTDVDLVVAEPSTGLILFVQLKHQDLYGEDLHAETQRKERLSSQVERWINSVDEWLSMNGPDNLSSTLRLPKKFPEPMIRTFILTRHFAGNLQKECDGKTLLSANWEVFYNSVHLVKQNSTIAVVNDLLDYVEKGMEEGASNTYLPEPESEWIVRDLKFKVQQIGNVEAAE